jgi:cbb3-type cytochrome oxidase subunit 3
MESKMMQVIIVILFSFTMLFSEAIQGKLIIGGDNDLLHTQADLMKLKSSFIENQELKELQEKYKLKLEMEVLGDYAIVVIKPVGTLVLKHELLSLLKPLFPDIFFIAEKRAKIESSNSDKKPASMTNPVSSVKVTGSAVYEFLAEEVGFQWLVLLLLALIGLTLSIYNRRKLATLEKTQQDLSLKQERIEDEIKQLGGYGV